MSRMIHDEEKLDEIYRTMKSDRDAALALVKDYAEAQREVALMMATSMILTQGAMTTDAGT